MRRTAMLLSRGLRTSLGMAAGLVVVGVGSELTSGTGGSVADLTVGLVIGIAGVIVVARQARDAVGWLLLASSLLWFAGTLASASGAVGSAGRSLQFSHRGPLLVALVVPIWMVRSARASIAAACLAVGVGACAVSIGPWATSSAVLVIIGAITVATAIDGRVRGVLLPWRFMWIAAVAATVLWVAAATSSLWWETLGAQTRLFAYQLSVACAALAMGASSIRRRAVVDEIVDIGRDSGLGGALGDPSLRLGFEESSGLFRAIDGSLVAPIGLQVNTDLELGVDGRARVVHRRGLLDDARVRTDVETAAGLLGAQHRLTREVQAHADEVRSSRARLIVAEDSASTAFGRELDRRVVPHLDAVLAALSQDAGRATRPVELASALRSELADLAAGAAPTPLDRGLRAALATMAAEAPIATEISLDQVDVDEHAARTLYFVAAEALSNAIKHSGATRVAIRLTEVHGDVELTIDDDGNGEVAHRPGGGLSGLEDRLASCGGSLVVERQAGQGTSVRARLDPSDASLQLTRRQTGIVIRSV